MSMQENNIIPLCLFYAPHLILVHHLVTVLTFTLTIYHSIDLSLQTKNLSGSQILSIIAFLCTFVEFHLLHCIPEKTITIDNVR